MADLADVEIALVELIAGLFPDGVVPGPLTAAPCRVYRGWPVESALDADMAAGIVNVSVFSVPGSGRNTTRWGIEDTILAGTPALTVAVVGGNSVVFGGRASAGQGVGLLVGATTYVYQTHSGDTPGSVVAALAGAAGRDRRVWASGTVITLPDTSEVVARVVANGSALQEVRRQEQTLRISLWCPDPALRDAATGMVDVGLATQAFVPFADGSMGRLRYAGTTVIDQQAGAHLYRRELMYVVEYPTTVLQSLPAMLFGQSMLTGAVVDATPGVGPMDWV